MAATTRKRRKRTSGKRKTAEDRKLEQYPDEEFHSRVPTERHAHDLAVATLHPEGVSCPSCHGRDVTPVDTEIPVTYRCDFCNRRFNVLSDTLLDGLEIPLREILWAVLVFTSLPMFSTPEELTYRLGWDEARASEVFFRFLMAADRPRPQLRDNAEMDWTWLRCVDQNGRRQRVLVIGLSGRHSKTLAALEILRDQRAESVGDFIFSQYLGPGLFADDHGSNRSLRDFIAERANSPFLARIVVQLCNHNQRRFVEGPASTNLVEGSWSRLKKLLRQYDWFGDRSLTHVLNAFVWWDNIRERSHQERIDDLMRGLRSKRPARIRDEFDFEFYEELRQLEFDLRNILISTSTGREPPSDRLEAAG